MNKRTSRAANLIPSKATLENQAEKVEIQLQFVDRTLLYNTEMEAQSTVGSSVNPINHMDKSNSRGIIDLTAVPSTNVSAVTFYQNNRLHE